MAVTPLGSVYGQEFTISGYVEDQLSGERIPGVELFFPELERGTVTNSYGYYSYATTSTEIKLLVLHLSYEPLEYNFELLSDTTLNVSLSPRSFDLEELEILARPDRAIDKSQMSEHNIEIGQIESLPVIFGEADVQKVLQLLPGVQGGQEGSSGLYVRGGRSDQNLILLDGLPVYNPNHVFGFFSVFPAQALKGVKLLKGGFPARYGGRLSSVVDYTMKEGNLREFKQQVTVGLLASQLLVEGPIKKDKSSFLLSGRRSFIDLILYPFQSTSDESTMGHFYDLHFKANYIASSQDRVYLSGYAGRDVLTYRNTTQYNSEISDNNSTADLGWGNQLLALRWNRIVGDRTFFNVLAGITSYRYALDYVGNSQAAIGAPVVKSESSWDSRIVDGVIKMDVEYNSNSRHYLRFGLEGIWHRVEPGRTRVRSEDQDLLSTESMQDQIHSGTVAAYVEDELFLSRQFRANLGLRTSAYFGEGKSYWSFEPRVNVSLRLSNSLAIKTSGVTVQQYIHLLTRGGAQLPNDLWVPTTGDIRPQRGQQIAVGLAWSDQKAKYEISLESYWRQMQQLLEYRTNANAPSSAVLDWMNLIEEGSGEATGLELFARKKAGRWTGWIGYTLSQSTRQFENLNRGDPFPDGFDRRHDLSIVSNYRINSQIEFAATWVYGSGYPLWLPIGRYTTIAPYAACSQCNVYPWVDFGSLNSSRAPSYHRMDINFHFQKTIRYGIRTISLGLYNAYGRQNPSYVYAKVSEESFDEPLPVILTNVSFFRWMPSISYQLKF